MSKGKKKNKKSIAARKNRRRKSKRTRNEAKGTIEDAHQEAIASMHGESYSQQEFRRIATHRTNGKYGTKRSESLGLLRVRTDSVMALVFNSSFELNEVDARALEPLKTPNPSF